MQKIISLIYNLIPQKFKTQKRFYKILSGELRGTRIFSQLVITQILGLYEKNLYIKIKDQIKELSHILVLGNHNGYSTLKMKYIYPNTKIIAVEANKNLCEDFKKTMSNSHLINDIILEESTIGYKNSSFSIDENSSDMVFNQKVQVSKNKNKKFDNQNLNKIISLKQLLKKYDFDKSSNNLIFIDIEGFEDEILKNEDKNIFENFKHIMIEYHSLEIRNNIVKFFSYDFYSNYKLDFLDKNYYRNQDNNGHVLISKH